jgi:hypothetical protein
MKKKNLNRIKGKKKFVRTPFLNAIQKTCHLKDYVFLFFFPKIEIYKNWGLCVEIGDEKQTQKIINWKRTIGIRVWETIFQIPQYPSEKISSLTIIISFLWDLIDKLDRNWELKLLIA